MIKALKRFFSNLNGNPFDELTREERLAITAAADAAWRNQ